MAVSKLFLVKILSIIVIFFGYLVIFPDNIYAQICSQVVRNRLISCKLNDDSGICEAEYAPTQTYYCDPSTCQTWIDLCTSDDCRDGLPPEAPYGCWATPACTKADCGGGGGGCDTTVPSVQSIEWGRNTVTINFNGGAGGIRNDIAFGSNNAKVAVKCALLGVGCTTMNNVSSPLTVTRDLFSNGTVYYFKVWNIDGGCTLSSAIKQDISSCEISPNNINLTIGGSSQTLTSDVVSTWVSVSSPTDVRVTFSSGDTSVARVSPSSETNSYVYQTSVSPFGVGSTNLNSNTYLDNVLSCTATASTVSVSNPSVGNPWWQVIDGDVTTNQSLDSNVFTGDVFDENGLVGGFPGVPVYGTSLSVVPGTISSTNWSANTTTTQPRVFDYSYFEGLIPDDVVYSDIGTLLTGGTVDDNGYEWYKVNGNLSVDSLLSLTTRKVILFVSDNLNINNEIWVTDGVGFFGTFVGGNINVAGTVTRVNNPSLEGIYQTDGVFNSGVGTGKLFVRGSVAAIGGINLLSQRDLPDDTNPAEVFKYAPDQILLFPKELSFKRTKWTEVSP